MGAFHIYPSPHDVIPAEQLPGCRRLPASIGYTVDVEVKPTKTRFLIDIY